MHCGRTKFMTFSYCTELLADPWYWSFALDFDDCSIILTLSSDDDDILYVRGNLYLSCIIEE